MSYTHAEAFCLMKYVADDGSEQEWIWNSRDGVTPFVITLRSGKLATHHDWDEDLRVPNYEPKPGTRMFVDLTEERAREKATKNAAHYWDNNVASARHFFSSKEELANYLLESVLKAFEPGTPDLVEVGQQ